MSLDQSALSADSQVIGMKEENWRREWDSIAFVSVKPR